ncbi:MAG: PIG-L family deacetylase [Anaerolineales bacterium]|nr:PIG-L family deacetylase [Anaerolineales bacterium]
MGVFVVLSPHLDDAVFSCGGWMAQRASAGAEVRVLTICAGDPPPGPLSPFAERLHARWGTAVPPASVRRTEDRIATGRLGALARHLDIPEALYRKADDGSHLYPDEAAIFNGLHAEDARRVDPLKKLLSQADPNCQILCPLGIGGHVDHQLTRLAAEKLGLGLWYYYDLPYASRGGELSAGLGMPAGIAGTVPLAPEEIEAWASAAAEYRSQLGTFWTDPEHLLRELTDFHDAWGGVRLILPQGSQADSAPVGPMAEL